MDEALAVLSMILGLILGIILTTWIQHSKQSGDAVLHGCAHYEMSTLGETTFHWNDEKKENANR